MKTTATLTRWMPIAAPAVLVGGLLVAAPAGAQTRVVSQDVCVSVDEAHDTLAPDERTAARLLVAKQFGLEGWRVVADGCALPYTIAHVRLGRTITVTLAGPNGRREGTALGLEDLPALYSQMVRSIVTGRPMTGMHVIDRTNVTAAQAEEPNRVASESFAYARLGAGRRGPSIGFGHRSEMDTLAIDVSFLNLQPGWASGGSSSAAGGSSSASAWTLLKLEGLHFRNPVANSSLYFGGGFGWGGASSYSSQSANWTSWHGSGLQGELTVGYETGRASTLHLFVQADATLPFYAMTSSSYSRTGVTLPSGRRYAPSLVVSVGVGWQRKHQ